MRKKTTNQDIAEEDLISKEVLWDIIQFSQSLSQGLSFPGIMTPELISSRLKDITMNPLPITEESLNASIRDIKNSEIELQGFAQSLETLSMPYKRSLLFLTSIPAFDWTIVCTNAKPEDYKKSNYLKDEQTAYSFLDKFDVREQFSVVLKQLLRQETFFGWLRDDNAEKYVLQELPSSPQYTRITGRWSNGLLGSFAMNWFLQPGVSLDFYPPFFKKKFLEVYGGGAKNVPYNPPVDLNLRGSGFESNWIYWVDLPIENAAVFKFDPTIATRVPFFLPMFSDWINQPIYRNLQKSKAIASAAKIIFGEVPMLNKDTKASVKDSFAITPDTLGKFLALVKTGIGDALKVTSAPLTNVQGIEFPMGSDGKLYEDYIRTTTSTSGINSNLIFSSTQKMNAIETQLSLATDELMMEKVYPMFEDFLNYQINRRTGKFKFKVLLEGSNFYLDRQRRLDNQLKLVNLGIVLPQKIAASIGMTPPDFYRQMEQARSLDFIKKLTPIIPATNAPAGAGRPKSSESDLGEAGAETRSQGSNEEKEG